MVRTLKHSVLIWLLIVVQVCTILLGQGWVVVCHRANGSSHVELFSEYSPENRQTNVLEHDIDDLVQGVLSNCSDAPCVDELFSIGYIITRTTRHLEIGHALGIIPTGPPSAVLWTEPVAVVGSSVVASSFSDALPLIELQTRTRSTVLIL